MWRKKGPKAPTASADGDMWKSSGYRRPAGGTWIKGWMKGPDISETKALSGSTLGGDVTSGSACRRSLLLGPVQKTRREWQKSITWTYLVSLETGFSFDLQSAGDSCSAAERHIKTNTKTFDESTII